MKTLLLDIETAPNVVYTWGLRDQNISLNQIEESSYVMCWAAKWLDKDKVHFSSVKSTTPKLMLKGVHDMLDEADMVVHYNGTSFDIPTLNKEFILNRMSPPAPYKQVDLYRTGKGVFRFQSHKLDYITNILDLGQKIRHEGQELWTKCMKGDNAAWKRMKKYNIQDVVLLEKLYHRILPWLKGHPNMSAYSGTVCCPRSAKHVRLQKRGPAGNATGTYQRYQCMEPGCGAWARGPVTKHSHEIRTSI